MKLPTAVYSRPFGSFIISVLFLFLVFTRANAATYYFNYSKEAVNAYQDIIALRMDDAKVHLDVLKAQEPNNLVRLHLENYIDFFVLFVTEDKATYKATYGNRSNRIKQLDAAKVEDPHYRFIKAEILLQWALIKLKFNEKLSAGSDIYSAYKLLEDNVSRYPNFAENKKSLSIMHAVAESLPNWVLKIIGVKGSVTLGAREIDALYQRANDPTYIFRHEVIAINAYILHYLLNQKQKAWTVLNSSDLDHRTNPMIAFLKSSLALRMGKNEESLKYALEAPRTKAYLPFYYLDFMVGRSYMGQLDPLAKTYIAKYVNNFKGEHYIKEAYQKLAWCAIIYDNDAQKYNTYMRACEKYGQALLDEDQQALKEAKQRQIPNTALLQSRILFDGGYYAKAQNVLVQNEAKIPTSQRLEYAYRLGRTLQALRNYDDAIPSLLEVYGRGKDDGAYFACNAALQLGIIHEEINQKATAKKYYELCLATKSDEYQSSIHQKAKAGLGRVR